MPTARLRVAAAVAGVAALAGAAFGVEEFVLVALAAAGVVVFGALSVRWRARRVRGALGAAVLVPVPEAGVADVVVARLVLSGTRGLPPLRVDDPAGCWVLSHPGIGGRPASPPPDPAPHRGGRPLSLRAVGPGRPIELPVPVPTTRRGVWTLHGVRILCDDPLGLFLLPVAVVEPARLLVCPAPGGGGATPASGAGGRSDRARIPAAPGPAQRPPGDELDRLRPYVPGDRLSRLHWQALARSGDLVVREFAAGDLGRIALLLDVRPGSDEALFEAAVQEVAAIGVKALAEGNAVELCTSAGERLDLAPGPAGTRALLRALAMVGPALPSRDALARWGRHRVPDTLWATDNLADAGQVFVTAGPADGVLPEAVSQRTSVVVVR
ncbi:MAG TPA: DUF58 domain-containing protein [Acidimicrobiales bacterium]|nr:DUF58 domain-containing protein [Acidimicrobiales bacterium]